MEKKMTTRKTTHVLKHSNVLNRPLPTSLMTGEPIVNTADGIMYFSGVTASDIGWNPSLNPGFFEVGSNLYNLKIRNKINSYGGITDMTGKFLSGTTEGFVLSDISEIKGIDTFVTGATIENINGLVLKNNLGDDVVLSDAFMFVRGSRENSIQSATGGAVAKGVLSTAFGSNTTASGVTSTAFGSDTQANGVNSTAFGSMSIANGENTIVMGSGIIGDAENTTYVSNFNIFDTPDDGDSSTDFILVRDSNGYIKKITTSSIDTFVTGFAFSHLTNTITLSQNLGQEDLFFKINEFSGLTITNDLKVGGNTVIDGNLTVLGDTINAYTSELYVEDSNIILNYNPTGSTQATSVGSGFSIKDGSGVAGSSVTFEIRPLNNFIGLNLIDVPNVTEYTSDLGYTNRGFVTQLNDIVIRSNNTETPNGVRVLAEFDVLSGGEY